MAILLAVKLVTVYHWCYISDQRKPVVSGRYVSG